MIWAERAASPASGFSRCVLIGLVRFGFTGQAQLDRAGNCNASGDLGIRGPFGGKTGHATVFRILECRWPGEDDDGETGGRPGAC